MQFQTDILGCPMVRPVDTATTALGTAYLAGLACNVWKSVEEVEKSWRAERVFEPVMGDTFSAGWKRAVAKA